MKQSDESKWGALRRAAREDQDFFIELCTNPRDAVRGRFDAGGVINFSDRDIELIEQRLADLVGSGSAVRPTVEDLRTMWDLRDRLESDWGGPWAYRNW